MANGQSLNFLLTEGENSWYARCLEYDFVTQAPTLINLLYEIQRTIIGRLVIGAQQGIDPFLGLKRADERYWELFRKSGTVVQPQRITLSGISTVRPVRAPELHELRIAEEVA